MCYHLSMHCQCCFRCWPISRFSSSSIPPTFHTATNSKMKMTSHYISFSFVIFRRRPSLASAGGGLQLLQNAPLVKIRHEAYIETIAIITKISRVYLKLPTYLQLKFCDIFVFYTYSIYSFIPFPQVGCVKI